jgi:spore germination protein GerM
VTSSGRLAAPLLAVAIGLAGCVLPTNQTATVFNDAPSPSLSSCAGPISISIYLVDTTVSPERLTPVVRPRSAKNGDEPFCALETLNLGPTVDEQIKGLVTRFLDIPEGLALVGDLSGGTATVQLDASFLSIAPGRALAEAFGQVVFTLTGLNVGISKVQFIFENSPYQRVLLPDGTIRSNGLVSRADYCSIGPVDQRC